MKRRRRLREFFLGEVGLCLLELRGMDPEALWEFALEARDHAPALVPGFFGKCDRCQIIEAVVGQGEFFT